MHKIKNFILNFGPQHPAAHGVLRLIVELQGEKIIRIDPHIGLLHRGTEKLIEYKTYTQALPYVDRLDYVSMMMQEHCYSLLIEKLLQIKAPQRAQAIRVIYSELTRILNHLLAITTHALDIGALTPFLWGFEEREKLMEFYERICGARMHANYFRPGGVQSDLPLGTLDDIYIFICQFLNRINELEELLSKNRIFKQRLVNIGIITIQQALSLGLSGPILRSAGLKWDLRINNSYDIYSKLNFSIPVGNIGDCFDRYNIRCQEMKISCSIINQAIFSLVGGKIKTDIHLINPPSKSLIKYSMEQLIHHFKYYTENIVIPNTNYYQAVEAPKGEFGIFLSTSHFNKPLKCKFKAPGFLHLYSLHTFTSSHILADIVTILGSLDIVFGEIDK